jgi:hypothetical protein
MDMTARFLKEQQVCDGFQLGALPQTSRILTSSRRTAMYRCLGYLTVLCFGLAIGGCAPSESQRAKDQVDESAKSQKLAVDRDAEATKKAVDETAVSTKDAIKQNVDSRRTADEGEATSDRQKSANLEGASERAKTDALEADKRAKADK